MQAFKPSCPPPGKGTPELPPLPWVVELGMGNESAATGAAGIAGAAITLEGVGAGGADGLGSAIAALRLEVGT
jgi:hypothetical protein